MLLSLKAGSLKGEKRKKTVALAGFDTGLMVFSGLRGLQSTDPQVRLRRAALRELAQLDKTTAADADLARQLTHLVRRYAVARFGRDAVATLSGRRWIDFVVAHGGTPWGGEVGLGLLRAAYGGPCQPARERWVAGAQAFFRAKA